MPIDDPNDPQEPQVPQEPAPAPEPESGPQYDVNQAYDVIAQAEGWDPRLTRYEIQEHKRRVQEFERERKEFERQRAQRYETQDETADPYIREQRETRRMLQEYLEKQRQKEEEQELITNIGRDAHASYVALARQAGMTKEQMEANAQEFYETLNDLYPAPSLVRAVGTERAAMAAFRLLNQSNHGPQRSHVSGRGPTATRTIPGSPQPYMGAGNPLPPEENLSAEPLPGETNDQYEARLRRIIEGANVRKLPDGMKVSSA